MSFIRGGFLNRPRTPKDAYSETMGPEKKRQEKQKRKTERDLLNPDPYYGGLWLRSCLNIYYK